MLVKVNILQFAFGFGLSGDSWEVLLCHKFLKKTAKKIKLVARQ
ncbi:hypothetical protein HMPREF9069_00976 [Atopobium sp. oral taxon 810 str. F0209]|nr:hypothetical protein HMPREF9069_00976 [Atopobium sp. oral taxon 810 str. F0209]